MFTFIDTRGDHKTNHAHVFFKTPFSSAYLPRSFSPFSLRKFVLLVGCFFMLFGLCGCEKKEPKKVIAVTQILAHSSADAVRKGIQEGLAEAGYVDGKNMVWVFENAQGNVATSVQIAQKFVGMHPDIIVPITTPSAQTVASVARDRVIPIVFAAVTDPVHAQLVTDRQHPGGNITGVTDGPPIGRQLDLITQIMPHIKVLGILYNPGETNPAKTAYEVDTLSKQMGFIAVKIPVSKISEVGVAFKRAVDTVDAVYVPLDNTVLSAMDQVVALSYEYGIPVFSSDSHSVTQGALASVGFSHYETGKKAAQMIVRIFKGEDPGKMQVESPANVDVYLNLKSADKLHIMLPKSLVQKAKEVTR